MPVRAFLPGLILVVLVGVAPPLAGQSLDWVKQEGRTISTGGQSVDSAEAVAVDSAGNSYVTGTFRIEATFGAGEPNQTVLRGVGPQDIFVAKFDPNGLLLWARSAGSGFFNQDFAWGIGIDTAGNSYVTGWLGSGPADFGGGVTTTSFGAFVVKYDTNGTAIWARTLDPNALGFAIAVDADGNSFVTGSAPGPVLGLGVITVWKVNTEGTTLWTRSAAGVYGGASAGISVDADGNSAVTGLLESGDAVFGPGEPNETTITAATTPVVFVAKYDTSGTLTWARQSADQAGSFGRGNAISTDTAGNISIVGLGSPILGLGEPNETPLVDAFVARYDGAGHLMWAKSVAPGFGQVSWVKAVATNSNGETYLTGTSIQGNVFIQKYSVDGGLLWSRRVAAVASLDALALSGQGISVDGAGNAYVAGQFSGTVIFGPGEPRETTLRTTSGNFDFDILLLKYLNDAPGANVPPVADDQNTTTLEDTPLPITLTATDANGDQLTYEVQIGPIRGVLSGAPPEVIYTPQPNYFGPDSFTFRAFDGQAFSNVATVTISVTPVNDAPVANDQALTTPEDTPLGITLTGQDVESDPLVFSVVSGPSHGTLSGTPPLVTYTPALDYVGPDSFTYAAFDGAAFSAPATVAISVGLTNLACGTLTSGRISAAGETDRFSFAGQAGQIISLALASTGGFATNPGSSGSVELMVFAPSGALIGHLRSNSQGNVTLPVTGSYAIRVNATNLATTGSYNLNLECLLPTPIDAVPLTCGALSAGRIEAPGDVDLFSFTGQAGQIVSLALASTGGFATNPGSSGSAELMVFASSGALIGHLRSNSRANITLPVTGPYAIRVNATNLATTGSFSVQPACP